MLLPVLVEVGNGSVSKRRFSDRDFTCLTREFTTAWALYKKTRKTPFRKNILPKRSAPSVRHVWDKCVQSVRCCPSLIYLYSATGPERTLDSLFTSGGKRFPLVDFLNRLDEESMHPSVIIVDCQMLMQALLRQQAMSVY